MMMKTVLKKLGVFKNIVTEGTNNTWVYFENGNLLVSYSSIIAVRLFKDKKVQVYLNRTVWDYSNTTGKHRNAFLFEDKKTTQAKINNGTYKLIK